MKLIPYKGGDFTIPSIFAIDDKGNELIGHEAKRQWQLNPRNTVYAAKRLVGRALQLRRRRRPCSRWSPTRCGQGDRNDVVVDVAKHELHAWRRSRARILNKIRDVAQDYLQQKVERAVVTVPAYFTDRQRQAVKDAGKLIGLEVVRIINEPTAAALAYGVGKELTREGHHLRPGRRHLRRLDHRDPRPRLRGEGHRRRHLPRRHRLRQRHDPARARGLPARSTASTSRSDPVAMQRIKDLAERTKIDLSARDRGALPHPVRHDDAAGAAAQHRDEASRAGLLEELTTAARRPHAEIVARTCWSDAGVDTEDIDEVMLVGGQTRMPIVQERLTQFFGKPPSKGVHPDEAVAIGAALYANSLEGNSDLRLQLLDVIPMAIGIEQAGGAFHVVFPRNAAIPNAKSIQATTSFDGQTELAMRIFQGDNDQVAHNELLGDFPSPASARRRPAQARVEITFDVNIEGILTMSAHDPDTGSEMKTTVRVTQS